MSAEKPDSVELHDPASWDEWPGDTYVIIPCSGAKLDRSAPARQLYTGSLFRLALAAALNLTDAELVRVLSARHGLVGLDTELAPYDVRMGERGSVTVDQLRRQADELTPAPALVVLLTPAAYTAPALAVWPAAVVPLVGARGIGEMRGRLARIRDRELAA